MACHHLERVDGRCVACGDCQHDIVLNGACLACGETDVGAWRKPKAEPALIPADELVRKR